MTSRSHRANTAPGPSAWAWSRLIDQPVAASAVQAIDRVCRVRTVPAGQALISQSEQAGDVYLILVGTARAVRYTANGHAIWLSRLAPGDLVGELAPLIDTPRTSDVWAQTELRVSCLPGADFLRLLDGELALSRALTRILAHRLKATSDQLVAQVAFRVTSRLHAFLARQAKPSPEDDEVRYLAFEPSKQELANEIHTKRETASRAMRELKDLGLVKEVGPGLEIIVPKDVEV